MKVFLDNVSLSHNSGPNNFASKLNKALNQNGVFCSQDFNHDFDIKLSFISERVVTTGIPLIQRLDGIYFDIMKNNDLYNKPIKDTYFKSDAVIFQSEYSKKLIFKHFGAVEKFAIINNGTDLANRQSLPRVIDRQNLSPDAKIWCCAAHWRPFKRLSENIRYFLEFSGPDDILLVAGAPTPDAIDHAHHNRITFLGSLNTTALLSVFNSVDNFIHLGRYDSCPNVVVEARAAGCNIICCSNGGTREIAGPDAMVVMDEGWDYGLVDVNNPPKLDFSNIVKNNIESNIDINFTTQRYIDFFNQFKE